MTTFLATSASTTPHDATRPTSPTTNKKRLGALAAGMLLVLSGTALWSVTAVATAAPGEAGSSVRLAGAVTSTEERREPSEHSPGTWFL